MTYRHIRSIKIKKTLPYLLLFFLLLPEQVFSAERPVARVILAEGGVMIRKPGTGRDLPVRAGDKLFPADVLRTGRDSRAQLVFTDDSVVMLSSGAAVRVDQYSFNPDSNRRTATLRVLEGKARFVIYKDRSPDSAFKVETRQARITSDLADFVTVVSAGQTDVTVLDGTVSVTNSSFIIIGETDLGPNEKTTVREKSPPSRPSVISPEQRRTLSRDAHHF